MATQDPSRKLVFKEDGAFRVLQLKILHLQLRSMKLTMLCSLIVLRWIRQPKKAMQAREVKCHDALQLKAGSIRDE